MNIKQKLFLKVFTLIFSLSFFSQNKNYPSNPLDENYTPKGNGPLSSEFTGYGSSGDEYYPQNIVKWNLGLLVRGAGVLNYEYNIKKVVSLLGIGGVNFAKDFIFSAVGLNILSLPDQNPNVVYNIEELYNKSKFNGVSPYLGAGIKILLKETDHFKFLQVDYTTYTCKTKYNFTETTQDILGNTIEHNYSFPIDFNFSNLSIKYIWQNSSEPQKIVFTSEFYVSLNIRFLNYSPILKDDNSNYSLGDKIKTTSFYIGAGYIIGFGFGKHK
ncbi:MAG TPA: hypothetical protein PK995_04055 [Bacteroidia bacterium]|nr:hypothetical protein [Bacteroidia bacterium]